MSIFCKTAGLVNMMEWTFPQRAQDFSPKSFGKLYISVPFYHFRQDGCIEDSTALMSSLVIKNWINLEILWQKAELKTSQTGWQFWVLTRGLSTYFRCSGKCILVALLSSTVLIMSDQLLTVYKPTHSLLSSSDTSILCLHSVVVHMLG